MSKQVARLKRLRRSRGRIRESDDLRLSVHKTPKHIYAQVTTPDGARVLAAASSIEAGLRSQKLGPGKLKMAETVGALIAERAKKAGVLKVAFDRSGFKYHGRLKSLAEAARAAGLQF